MLIARLVIEVDKDDLNIGMARRVLLFHVKLFYIRIVILSIDVIKNVLILVMEKMKHVIKSFLYVFFAYYLHTFYYLYSSFTILCIYIITLCLVSTFFACSI